MFKLRRSLFRVIISVAAFSILIGLRLHGSRTTIVYDGVVLADTQQLYIEAPSSDEPESDIQIPTITNPIPEPISIRVTPTPYRKPKLTRVDRAPSTTETPRRKRKRKQKTLPTMSPVASSQRIAAYHRDSERRCLEDYANDTHPPGYYCPCLPTEFHGKLEVSNSTSWNWSDVSVVVGDGWMRGGEWKPANCVARYHMAVIIPFRDRDYNLKALLRHLIPILRRQFLHFRIFVVEQNSPALFNKASMMNIGFLEASKLFPEMNCIMFQDADSLAEDDRLLMRCDRDRPHHYALVLNRWGYRMSYGGQFGGAVTIRPEMFRRINGFPIVYFGWGGEDDDMGSRVRKFYRRLRPPMVLCRYTTLSHARGKSGSNPRNNDRMWLMRQGERKYRNRTFEGIQQMSYTIESIERRRFYTYIHSNLNTTGLPYRNHTQYSYAKLDGVCDDRFYNRVAELSSSTCRFLCDTAWRRPCYGYTYYVIPPHEADLGTTMSECKFLTETCSPTRRKRKAFTYIREQSTIPSVTLDLMQ